MDRKAEKPKIKKNKEINNSKIGIFKTLFSQIRAVKTLFL